MIPTKLTEALDNLNSHSDGVLILQDQTIFWTLHISNGQLLYASDRLHPVRRWHRTLKLNYPKWNWLDTASQIADNHNWECQILNQGIKQNQLSLIRTKLVIRTVIQECLFELMGCSNLQSYWKPQPHFCTPFCQSAALSAWEIKTLLSRAIKNRQEWLSANLGRLSPNLSPKLNQEAEPETLPVSRHYLTGELTLWDIALQLKKTVAVVAQALKPLAENHLLTFQSIPDLSPPRINKPINNKSIISTNVSVAAIKPAAVAKQNAGSLTSSLPARIPPIPFYDNTASPQGNHKQPTIACIEDSPVIIHTLRRILVPAGYRMISIPEPMRGFTQLIEFKPDLILLDLLLPNADGYSICNFLRHTPVFAKTPIIILTGQNTLLDRSQAISNGASGFLVKPPQEAELLQIVGKFLEH